MMTTTTAAKNKIEQDCVTILNADRYYPGNYTILPSAFRTKRSYNVRIKDLESTLKEAAKSEKDITIFVGEIKGIVPVREMLEKTGEISLVHIHYSMNPPSSPSNPITMSQVLDESKDHHTYTELFEFGVENRKCNHWNCSICHADDEEKISNALGGVNPNDDLGSYLISQYMIGRSLNDKEALKNYTEKSIDYLKAKRIEPYHKINEYLYYLEKDNFMDEMDLIDKAVVLAATPARVRFSNITLRI